MLHTTLLQYYLTHLSSSLIITDKSDAESIDISFSAKVISAKEM
jgi:hypothetical protein